MSDDEFTITAEGPVEDGTALVITQPMLKKEQSTSCITRQQERSISFSLRSFLLGITLIVGLVGLLSWFAQIMRNKERETKIQDALGVVYLGISNFNSALGQLPADHFIHRERLLYSWRFRIGPYLGYGHLGTHSYRAAWDAPTNKDSRESPFWVYCFEGADAAPNTNLFAVVGPGAAFEHGKPPGYSTRRLEETPPNCVLVVEVADSQTNWMQPGDYEVEQLLAATGKLGDTVKGILPDRIHVLFADGEVWAFSPDTPMEFFKPFLTIVAAKTASREELLGPYRID